MNYSDIEDRIHDYTDSGYSKGNVLAGFLIGAGVGLLAGILLAPQAGKETISQIGERTGDWRNQLGSLVDKAGKLANQYMDQGKDMLQNARSQGQKAGANAEQQVG